MPTKKRSRPGTRAVRSSGKVKAMPIWAAQHVGKVRENQEDAFFVTPHVIGVFDGMGGHLFGEIASALARDVVKRAASEVGSAEVPWRPGILAAAIRTADQAIRGASLRGGGTTAVVAALDPNGIIVVAHLGDSRAYQYRPGVGIRQITEDHGVGNILFRALTGKGDLPDAARHSLARGDLLILCSDGLSDELTAEQIQAVLDKNPKDPAKALVNAVLLTPARDNVTVVVYRQP